MRRRTLERARALVKATIDDPDIPPRRVRLALDLEESLNSEPVTDDPTPEVIDDAEARFKLVEIE